LLKQMAGGPPTQTTEGKKGGDAKSKRKGKKNAGTGNFGGKKSCRKSFPLKNLPEVTLGRAGVSHTRNLSEAGFEPSSPRGRWVKKDVGKSERVPGEKRSVNNSLRWRGRPSGVIE